MLVCPPPAAARPRRPEPQALVPPAQSADGPDHLTTLPIELRTDIARHAIDMGACAKTLAASCRPMFDAVSGLTVTRVKRALCAGASKPLPQHTWLQLAQDARLLRDWLHTSNVVPTFIPAPQKYPLTLSLATHKVPFDAIEAGIALASGRGAQAQCCPYESYLAVELLDAHLDAAAPLPLRQNLIDWVQQEQALHNGHNAAQAAGDMMLAFVTGAYVLDLSQLQLHSLPHAIGEMRSLRVLHAADNRLTTLPANFCQLTHLKHLDLCGNALTEVPAILEAMPALQYVQLGHNQLTRLPDGLSRLVALRVLCVRRNRLTEIPRSLSALTMLRDLDLSGNRLEVIPEAVLTFRQLRRLCISNNLLTELPLTLGHLVALEDLDASSNQFVQAPPSIGALASLRFLNLSNNDMVSFGERITACRRLERLDLSTNRLVSVPDSLTSLFNLRVLNLRGNRLTHLPEGICHYLWGCEVDVRDNEAFQTPPAFADATQNVLQLSAPTSV